MEYLEILYCSWLSALGKTYPSKAFGLQTDIIKGQETTDDDNTIQYQKSNENLAHILDSSSGNDQGKSIFGPFVDEGLQETYFRTFKNSEFRNKSNIFYT